MRVSTLIKKSQPERKEDVTFVGGYSSKNESTFVRTANKINMMS